MIIQHYNHKTQSLEQPLEYKVQRILDLHCLLKQAEDRWVCRPIAGYNTRTYTLQRQHYGWSCNCQGYSKKQTCSHEQALVIYLRRIGDKNQLTLF